MVNCFTHILKMIDLFGQPVNLTIEHQTQAKTVIGGIMTLLALIGILVFGIYSAEDFYKQLNPTVTKTTYSNSKAGTKSVSNILCTITSVGVLTKFKSK